MEDLASGLFFNADLARCSAALCSISASRAASSSSLVSPNKSKSSSAAASAGAALVSLAFPPIDSLSGT